MNKKIILYITILITYHIRSQTPIEQLSHDQQYHLMKEDMLLKIITLYTIEKYLIEPLQKLTEADTQYSIMTAQQQDLMLQITKKMHEKDFIITIINNKNCIYYAFCKVKKISSTNNIDIVSPEEQVYGTIVSKAFEIVLSHSTSPEHAQEWIIRIMTYNPYRDYHLSYQEVEQFYQNAPIQEQVRPLWQNMWQNFQYS